MTGEPGPGPPRLVRVSNRLLLLAPARLALGAAGLAACLALGLDRRAGFLAWGTAALAATVVLLSDRRFALLARDEPEPVPSGAAFEPRWRVLVAGLFPSTVGTTLLAAMALALDRLVLAAFLAGVLAGMAVASLLSWLGTRAWEAERGGRLFVEVRGGRRFFEPRL